LIKAKYKTELIKNLIKAIIRNNYFENKKFNQGITFAGSRSKCIYIEYIDSIKNRKIRKMT